MERPASMMRGPGSSPAATASRSASVAPLPSPRLRTVVKPANNVFLALPAARYAARAGLSVTASINAALPPASLSKWTWLSIKPGNINFPLRSMMVAPTGPAWWPLRTSATRPFRIINVEAPRGALPGLSSSCPAYMTVTCSGVWAASATGIANIERQIAVAIFTRHSPFLCTLSRRFLAMNK